MLTSWTRKISDRDFERPQGLQGRLDDMTVRRGGGGGDGHFDSRIRWKRRRRAAATAAERQAGRQAGEYLSPPVGPELEISLSLSWHRTPMIHRAASTSTSYSFSSSLLPPLPPLLLDLWRGNGRPRATMPAMPRATSTRIIRRGQNRPPRSSRRQCEVEVPLHCE